jgi:hypothetical protein
MSHVTYEIVPHDGGFTYKVGDVFAETFPTREAAAAAARVAAEEQATLPVEDGPIEYQDARGRWRIENAGDDPAPETEIVVDDAQS